MAASETRKHLGQFAVAAAVGLNLLWIPCRGVSFDVVLMSLTVSRGPLAALVSTGAVVAYVYTFVALKTPRSSPAWRRRASIATIWSGLFLLTQVIYIHWVLQWNLDNDLRYLAWIAFLILMTLGPIATLAALRMRAREIIALNTCTECGYDLRGNPQTPTCPECGARVPRLIELAPSPPHPDRHRLIIGLVIVYLLWVGYGTFERYRLRREVTHLYQALNRRDAAVLNERTTHHFQASTGLEFFSTHFDHYLHTDDAIIFYGFGATTSRQSLFGVLESNSGTVWRHTSRGWLLDDRY